MCRTVFKVEQITSGLRDPRFLLTAPNGDVFISENRADQIKVTRPDGKIELFTNSGLNKPFGLAFYPSGNDPQFLYVANTNGVICFPYRNGDARAGRPKNLRAPSFPAEVFCAAAVTGRVTSFFHPTGKRCTSRLARVRMTRTMRPKLIARAFSNSIPMAPVEKFSRGVFATPSASHSVLELTSYG
jgi:hypothetical protein